MRQGHAKEENGGVNQKEADCCTTNDLFFFSRHKTYLWVETRMLEMFVSHGAELILLMQVQERKAQVVIISVSVSPRGDVNVWETNQFLVLSC